MYVAMLRYTLSYKKASFMYVAMIRYTLAYKRAKYTKVIYFCLFSQVLIEYVSNRFITRSQRWMKHYGSEIGTLLRYSQLKIKNIVEDDAWPP